jgi:DinB family protein
MQPRGSSPEARRRRDPRPLGTLAVDHSAGSARATALAADLEKVAEALVVLLEGVTTDRWMHVPGSGVWSIGKEAEHILEAAIHHQWIVRLTIGERVGSRRPPIERSRLTTDLSPRAAVDLLQQRTEEGASLIRALSDQQLDLPTRPPRARDARLAAMIEGVLIGHYRGHGDEIAAKLREAG